MGGVRSFFGIARYLDVPKIYRLGQTGKLVRTIRVLLFVSLHYFRVLEIARCFTLGMYLLHSSIFFY